MSISRNDRWSTHIKALEQFVSRTGTSLVPTTHIEIVDGRNIALGAWIAYNRQRQRQGTLSQERVAQLSSFAGWRWEKQKPGRQQDAERDMEIVAQYQQGKSARTLAEVYSLSRQRVHQIIRRNSQV